MLPLTKVGFKERKMGIVRLLTPHKLSLLMRVRSSLPHPDPGSLYFFTQDSQKLKHIGTTARPDGPSLCGSTVCSTPLYTHSNGNRDLPQPLLQLGPIPN